MENPSVLRKMLSEQSEHKCAAQSLRGRTDMETGTDRRSIQASIARIQVYSFHICAR